MLSNHTTFSCNYTSIRSNLSVYNRVRASLPNDLKVMTQQEPVGIRNTLANFQIELLLQV